MAVERLVALHVTDPQKYQQYRALMTPILAQHEGQFGYDFCIEKTLKSETNHPINRVFTLRFESEQQLQAFFTNADYLAIKKANFYPSVDGMTEIAKYLK